MFFCILVLVYLNTAFWWPNLAQIRIVLFPDTVFLIVKKKKKILLIPEKKNHTHTHSSLFYSWNASTKLQRDHTYYMDSFDKRR